MNHKTIKAYPDSENPYSCCLKSGTECLTEAQLLAIILRTGTKDCSAIDVARDFLCCEGGNLLNIYQMSIGQMQKIPGIGKVKAIQLKCIGELAKRIAKIDRSSRESLTDADLIAARYMEELRHEKKEKLVLVMLDMKCHFLKDAVISVGTVGSSMVSPREIFLTALEYEAVHLVILHNHPSGDPTPSREDIKVTKRVQQCGDLIGIPLLDHIIIGDNTYISLKEEGLFT